MSRTTKHIESIYVYLQKNPNRDIRMTELNKSPDCTLHSHVLNRDELIHELLKKPNCYLTMTGETQFKLFYYRKEAVPKEIVSQSKPLNVEPTIKERSIIKRLFSFNQSEEC